MAGQECLACQIRTTSVVNTAEMCIGSSFTDCDTDSVLIPITYGGPEITIEKTVSPSQGVASGDTVTYTMTLTNIGSGDAINILFEDIWPRMDVEYVSDTAVFPLSIDTTSQSISGTIGSLPVGDSLTFDIVGTVLGTPPSTITNIAQATYLELSGTPVTVQDSALIGSAGICNPPEIL